MNNDKTKLVFLLIIALGFVGYTYFLTMKVEDSENQINELKASLKSAPKNQDKKLTKYKINNAKYCENENYTIQKDNFK